MGRRRRPARCRGTDCGAPIVFFRSPYTGNTRAFDPTPVDGHDPGPGLAFPVMGQAAYKVPVLVELLQVQRQCSDAEAAEEVRDMPWHRIHQCTTPPTTEGETHP